MHTVSEESAVRRAIYLSLCLGGLTAVTWLPPSARAADAPAQVSVPVPGAGPASAYLSASMPVAVVEKLHAALLDTMKRGKVLGFTGRTERLSPAVHEAFDLDGMTRASVGAGWLKLPEDEKRALAEAFAAWTVATYASQFKDWGGETFVTTREPDPARPDALVVTEIRPPSGKATVLTYRLRRAPDGAPDNARWRVIDILLDGAVSQLALRRADFAAVFAKGGAPELTAHLKTLTARLAAAG